MTRILMEKKNENANFTVLCRPAMMAGLAQYGPYPKRKPAEEQPARQQEATSHCHIITFAISASTVNQIQRLAHRTISFCK